MFCACSSSRSEETFLDLSWSAEVRAAVKSSSAEVMESLPHQLRRKEGRQEEVKKKKKEKETKSQRLFKEFVSIRPLFGPGLEKLSDAFLRVAVWLWGPDWGWSEPTVRTNVYVCFVAKLWIPIVCLWSAWHRAGHAGRFWNCFCVLICLWRCNKWMSLHVGTVLFLF